MNIPNFYYSQKDNSVGFIYVIFVSFVAFFGFPLFIVYQLFLDIKEANVLLLEKINRTQAEILVKSSQVASQSTEVGVASNVGLGVVIFFGLILVCFFLAGKTTESTAVTNAIVEEALPKSLNIQTKAVNSLLDETIGTTQASTRELLLLILGEIRKINPPVVDSQMCYEAAERVDSVASVPIPGFPWS